MSLNDDVWNKVLKPIVTPKYYLYNMVSEEEFNKRKKKVLNRKLK